MMRRLEEVATPSLRWMVSTIICGVQIMIR